MKTCPGKLLNLFHAFILTGLDLLFRVFNRVEIRGQENIPSRGEYGVLILSNHISTLDPFLIGITAMPRFSPVRWRAAAKVELFQSTLSRWVMNRIGAFPVERGKHDIDSIERMVSSLKTDVLVTFPEGTWSFNGQLLPGRMGVGRVIRLAKPNKVLPVALKGTDRILPRGHIIPRMGQRAKIVFGAPIDFERLYSMPDDIDTAKEIVKVVMDEIGRLYAQLPEN